MTAAKKTAAKKKAAPKNNSDTKKVSVSIIHDDSDPYFRFSYKGETYESLGPLNECITPGFFRKNRHDDTEVMFGAMELCLDEEILDMLDVMSYQDFNTVMNGVQDKVKELMGASVGESAGSSDGSKTIGGPSNAT